MGRTCVSVRACLTASTILAFVEDIAKVRITQVSMQFGGAREYWPYFIGTTAIN